MKVVTCIGDSETWCYGLSRGLDWPYKLAQALDGGSPTMGTLSPWSGISDGTSATTGTQREYTGTNWTVRNAGVSGDTSRGMKARWATDVLGASVKPNYVLIMCGENDIYYAAPSGGNDSTYDLNATNGLKANVAWMVASALSNGIIPLLCTPTPHGTLETVADRWSRMQDWLKYLGTTMSWMSTTETANTLGCTLSDHYQSVYAGTAHPAYPVAYPTGSTYSLDNIHPNAAGAQVIANTAAAAIAAAPISASGTIVCTSTASLAASITATQVSYDLAADFVAATVSYDLASDFLTGTSYTVSGTIITASTTALAITARRAIAGTIPVVSAVSLNLATTRTTTRDTSAPFIGAGHTTAAFVSPKSHADFDRTTDLPS